MWRLLFQNFSNKNYGKYFSFAIKNFSPSLKGYRETMCRKLSDDYQNKTELERRLESINFSLKDIGNDDLLSIPYFSEEEMQNLVIDILVTYGVERDLITLDSDLINEVGISRFDVLQVIESLEAYLQYSMLDDDAIKCTTVRQIASKLHEILMYDKADQMHRGPYYHPSDLEQLVTFCMKVDQLSYWDYIKYLFSFKSKK